MSSEKTPLHSSEKNYALGDPAAELSADQYDPFPRGGADLDRPVDIFQRGAWMIEDAMKGFRTSGYEGALRREREQCLMVDWTEKYVHTTAVFLILLLTLFEVPLWCNNGSWDGSISIEEQCPTPVADANSTLTTSHAYFSNIPYLSKFPATICEGLLILVLMSTAIATRRLRHSEGDRQSNAIRIGITSVMAIDFIVFFVFNQYFNLDMSFRLSGYLRALLFFRLPPMKLAVANASSIIYPFFQVAVLLFGTVVVCAWVAAMIMDDLNDLNREGTPINDGFESLEDSLLSLFTASTTQDFPNQMIPSFIQYRSSFFFFFCFMVLTVMVFLSLVLAVVYNAYSDAKKGQMEAYFKNRSYSLKQAFHLISTGEAGERHVTLETFKKLIKNLNRSSCINYIREADLELYFSTLDDDNSKTIELKEFFDLCNILQFDFKAVPTQGCGTCLPCYDGLNDFVRKEGPGGLSYFVNIVLAINSFLVVVQSLRDLSDVDTTEEDEMWNRINFGFSIFYMLELFLRLTAMPFIEYWSDVRNRFDFIATLLLFGVGVAWAAPQIFIPEEMLRYFLLLQLLRLLRLLSHVKPLTFIWSCIFRMLFASTESIGLLFGVLYVYAFTGCVLFGGLIYDDNEALDGTDYRDSNFDVLNFNDMGLAMVSLFVMLVTAFVPEFYEAYTTVYDPAWVASAFWVSFYIVGILVFFNIFASFIIDVFLAQYEANEKSITEEETSSTQVQSGLKLVTTFKGSDDIYRKVFMEDVDEEDDE